MNCPICGGEIKEGRDRLIVEYYHPKDWFVTRHMRKAKPGSIEVPDSKYGEWASYCAQADIQAVIVKGQAAPPVTDEQADEAERLAAERDLE